MKLSLSIAISAALGASLVSAQLSSSCESALTSLAGDEDAAACLSPSSLAGLVLGGSDSSIVDPINDWLNAMCNQPACSNATVAEVVSNVTAGCGAELSALGFQSGQDITGAAQQLYPTLRQVLCLEQSGTKCVTQELTDAEDFYGAPLSINRIVSLVASGNTAPPSNITCTDCTKAAYNLVNEQQPSLASGASQQVESQCGASFTDGQDPSGVSVAAVSSTAVDSASGDNGALRLSELQGVMLGVGASISLVLLSSAYIFLA